MLGPRLTGNKSDVLRTEPLTAEERFDVCAPGDPLIRRGPRFACGVADLPLARPSLELGCGLKSMAACRAFGGARIHSGLKQFAQEGG
jgi:hypothetical protein